MKCPNCQHEFEGNFCSNCGQKAIENRLGMKEIFAAIPNALVAFESRYWNTIRDFYKNPYKMVRSYSQGKRKYYSAPIQFFYFFATIAFILGSVIYPDADSSEPFSFDNPDNSMEMDVYAKQLRWALQQLVHFAENYSNFFELGLPLIFGLLLYAFYHKKFNLAEAFAFAFFLTALAIEVPSILILPLQGTPAETYLNFFFVFGNILYAFAFIGDRKVLNMFSGLVLALLTLLVFVVGCLLILFFLYPCFH